MPIRFQVDPDFYDHPKVTGMSDTAFALWVRAGSYSAAKTTDGFISEDVLAHTLRYDPQVADELVQRRLWRRTRGGYRFHQWDGRNLTRERIEADRKADRDRKKSSRQQGVDNPPPEPRAGNKIGSPQVSAQNVRPDSGRNPPGVPVDSDRNPDVSVSVSSSVSSSGSSRGERPVGRRAIRERPPERCPKHANDERPPPCGACADARRAVEAWDRATTVDTTAAVRACTLCDADGWRWIDPGRRGLGPMAGPGARCDHVRQPVPT